jgi:hypothetical protein
VGFLRFIVLGLLLSPFLVSDWYYYPEGVKPIIQVEIYLDGVLWCDDEAEALTQDPSGAMIRLDLGGKAIPDGHRVFKARWANEVGWSPFTPDLHFHKGPPEPVSGVGVVE